MEVLNNQPKENSTQDENKEKGSGYTKKTYTKNHSKFQGQQQQKGGKTHN